MKKQCFVTLIFFTLFCRSSWAARQKYVVNEPVVNLFTKKYPVIGKQKPPVTKPREVPDLKTQVIFNEPLLGIEESGGWLRVEALEQLVCDEKNSWRGCIGWLEKKCVTKVNDFSHYNLVAIDHWVNVYQDADDGASIIQSVPISTKFQGQKLNSQWWSVLMPDGSFGFVKHDYLYHFTDQVAESEQELRNNIVSSAKKLLGVPFSWYCRSSYKPKSENQLTGMGCDGLIDVAFRMNGLSIPRFAQGQYALGVKYDGLDIERGDLIFYAYQRSKEVHHAMLYLGNDRLLEATFQSPGSLRPARIIGCEQRLHNSIKNIKNMQSYKRRYRVCFASYLSMPSSIKTMRLRACSPDLYRL